MKTMAQKKLLINSINVNFESRSRQSHAKREEIAATLPLGTFYYKYSDHTDEVEQATRIEHVQCIRSDWKYMRKNLCISISPK